MMAPHPALAGAKGEETVDAMNRIARQDMTVGKAGHGIESLELVVPDVAQAVKAVQVTAGPFHAEVTTVDAQTLWLEVQPATHEAWVTLLSALGKPVWASLDPPEIKTLYARFLADTKKTGAEETPLIPILLRFIPARSE